MSGARPASAIPGVRFGTTVRHADERGAFRELWRASGYPPEIRFVQANQSSSAAGVLRGLHLHRRQLDRWVVAAGRAWVALVDVRPMLARGDRTGDRPGDRPGRPVVETRALGADDWVDIPAGVAHGFLALEPLELIYLVTNEYDGADELGFAWDDPDAAVPWPEVSATTDRRPILSERDRSNPSLAEVVARIRG